MAGFTTAEGNFLIFTRTTGTCGLKFSITQHSRDEQLMFNLTNYLGCGKSYKHPDRDIVNYLCYNFLEISKNIIPFFSKYLVQGIKALDLNDWLLAAELIQNKTHLTVKGKEKIL